MSIYRSWNSKHTSNDIGLLHHFQEFQLKNVVLATVPSLRCCHTGMPYCSSCDIVHSYIILTLDQPALAQTFILGTQWAAAGSPIWKILFCPEFETPLTSQTSDITLVAAIPNTTSVHVIIVVLILSVLISALY